MIKSKKSVFAIVFAFIIGICAIVLPFTLSSKKSNVFADEPSLTSNLDVDQTWDCPFTFDSVMNFVGSASYFYLNLHFSVTKHVSQGNHWNNVFTFNFDIHNYYQIAGSTINIYDISYFKRAGSSSNLSNQFDWTIDDTNVYYLSTSSAVNQGWQILLDSDFDFDFDNIFYCDIFKGSSNRYINYRFIDVNNLEFNVIFFNILESVYNNFNSHTVYFLQSDSLMNNEFYQIGYDQGYNNGNSEGYADGYSVGQVNGDSAGYQRGYTAGVLAGGDYTFIGLIGSVVDAPIKAFTGLLNFEILGVNLSAFVYGLISICLVITIIKVIKGGR